MNINDYIHFFLYPYDNQSFYFFFFLNKYRKMRYKHYMRVLDYIVQAFTFVTFYLFNIF